MPLEGLLWLAGTGVIIVWGLMGLFLVDKQCSLLSICVASTWVQSPRVASIMLIAGVAASRLGLWMFDLSVTQLMQAISPALIFLVWLSEDLLQYFSWIG
jgi:hypothetical protein